MQCGQKSALNDVASLFSRKSYHIACSRSCGDVELASRSRNDGILAPKRKESASELLQDPSSLATLSVLEKSLPPALVGTATDIVEISVSRTFAAPVPEFKVFVLTKARYGAVVCDIEQPAHATRVVDSTCVEALRTVVREGRWVTQLGSLSVAEKSPLQSRRSLALKLWTISWWCLGTHRRLPSSLHEPDYRQLQSLPGSVLQSSPFHLVAKKTAILS